MVQKFGQHYWKRIPLEDIDKIWPKCCIEVKDVKTKLDVENFITKVMDESFDVYDYVLPYKAFLVPETDSGHGYVVLVETHAFADGIQSLASILYQANGHNLKSSRL